MESKHLLLFTRPHHGCCPEGDESNPHTPTHFFKMHFNIILPCAPRSFKWSLPFRFFGQALYAFFISCTLHAICSAHRIFLDEFTSFSNTRFNIIFHILVIPSGCFPISSPIKILYAFLISPMLSTCPACCNLPSCKQVLDETERSCVTIRAPLPCCGGQRFESLLGFRLS
jgi:hypothetical protein